MALAAGAKTYKLKYGNRGQNQPAVDQFSKRCYITSQNHGFAVDNKSLPRDWKPYFINANDGTNEGMVHTTKPFFSVQFHPEARVGPYDTLFLFDQFIAKVKETKEKNIFTAYDFVKQRKHTDVKKVLLLGSGGLQIGQAGEFDYSGAQAIKALREEGVQVILMNPNIATIQTAKGMADKVYFLPVTTEYVEEVIKREQPDGLLLGFGGQTALNTGVDLFEKGILKKYGVEVLGTQVDTIIATEDRDLFKQKLAEIDVKVAPSEAVNTVEDALKVAEKIKYPVIIRVAYALGGLGSGFANDPEELRELSTKALANAPQILVEKSVKGWKEVEYEVVRDIYNNTITVCNMENFDPMGIHTGESIVVAPSQTLTNEEYHKLRDVAIKTIQHLKIVGECNIQYALDPNSEDYCVIEVNARLSRSSALASKATGYPLAFVAAKLGLGIPLPEIRNSVTRSTTACFEPSLDYIVVKMPRWDLTKFTQVSKEIGSSMKSVGEVMSVGRSFEESIQKAIRMVNTGNTGYEEKEIPDLDKELTRPTDMRIFALAKAMNKGYTVDKLHDMTKIDKWFLHKLQNIHDLKADIRAHNLKNIPTELLRESKQLGFSDLQIAKLLNVETQSNAIKVFDEIAVRKERQSRGILPYVKQIDTLAAEYPAMTNYLYTTYNAKSHDVKFDQSGIMVLGSGVYRIGSSVEFDYCGVMTVRALRRMGYKTIMVNYNPETVSTDYDESDRLYFEELSYERVMDIYELEKASGVVVSVGGQQPNNIALKLKKNGANVLGTDPKFIDMAEDRFKFSELMDTLGIEQPAWKELSSFSDAESFCDRVGYPVLVRPSYVLSGAAMGVVDNKKDLRDFLGRAADVSPEHPVVITKFILGAMEIECDGVANKGKLINWAISEHVENAGVHSGDATMVLPADTVPENIITEVKKVSEKIAKALEIDGPFNIQYLYKDGKISVIECNLRASRSFPFVSKTYDVDFIENAAKVFVGKGDTEPHPRCVARKLPYVGIKSPMFSFQRLLGSDPRLGVEMASTGEVATFGKDRYEALIKSVESSRMVMPKNNLLLASGKHTAELKSALDLLRKKGFQFYATPETVPELQKLGVPFTPLALTQKAGESNVIDMLRSQKLQMVVNFPETTNESLDYYKMRRTAVDFAVPVIANVQLARELLTGLGKVDKCEPRSWDEYIDQLD
jgi:carbamoyl-phosphate synthase large subunit